MPARVQVTANRLPCFRLRDDPKTSCVSWPRDSFRWPGRRRALSFLKDHAAAAAAPSHPPDKAEYGDNEEDLAGPSFFFSFLQALVWPARVFGDSEAILCLVVPRRHRLNANVSPGCRVVYDLLDVASVSQGPMLSGYSRLEGLVVNVNS